MSTPEFGPTDLQPIVNALRDAADSLSKIEFNEQTKRDKFYQVQDDRDRLRSEIERIKEGRDDAAASAQARIEELEGQLQAAKDKLEARGQGETEPEEPIETVEPEDVPDTEEVPPAPKPTPYPSYPPPTSAQPVEETL